MQNNVSRVFTRNWLDLHHEAKLPEREGMVQDLNLPDNCTILDVGCGTGNFLVIFALRISKPNIIIGLDRSLELLKVASSKIEAKNLSNQVSLICGDLNNFPIISNRFDMIWCANTLAYCSEPKKALDDMISLLKQGGYIVVKDEDTTRDIMLSWDPYFELALYQAWAKIASKLNIPYDPFIGRKLFGLFQSVGLRNISVHTYLIERTYPLSEEAQEYIYQTFMDYRDQFEKYLSSKDWETFKDIFSPQSHKYLFNQKDLHFISTETVVKGMK